MNQGKLEVVKQEMARLGISDLKWTGMGEFNSDDHYIYYCGQEALRRNGVAIIVNKRAQNAVLGGNLKNNIMISVCFQGKPFNITVIQVCALIRNAEGAEVEWFYESLQDLLELIPKIDVLFTEKKKKVFFSDQCKEIEENNIMGKTRDIFKKIRDTKGIFHAKMGTIKDRNGMDLTEVKKN